MARFVLLAVIALSLGGCTATAVSVVGAVADVAVSALSATVDVVDAGVSGAIDFATSDDDDDRSELASRHQYP